MVKTAIKSIVKRDGRTVFFDQGKIADAIFKAANSLGGTDKETAKNLAAEVEEYVAETLGETTPTVEMIQDAVEKVLIESGHARTAKEFILYRAERTRVREMNTRLMKVYEDLTFKDASENDIKRENANIDGNTAMGTMLKYGSEGAKQFYEMFILDPQHSKAHIEGDIHIHDMDFLTLTTTCCQIDIDKLFEGGFSTGHGYIREPNDIQSYAALACIAIQSNQNDQHGGQSIPNFDYAMSKGVKKTYRRLYIKNLEKALELLADFSGDCAAKSVEIVTSVEKTAGCSPIMADNNGYREAELELLCQLTSQEIAEKIQSFTYRYSCREIRRNTYQAMEALVHNLNTMHSRAGAQIPFSSINYGTDTSPEGRLVIESILGATESGLGNGETAIFPIHIFKVKEGINYNPEDPNYELFKMACKVSAKRLFPNFSFLDAPFNLQYYKPGNPATECAYMGCRTRVIANSYDPSRQIVDGRGNLSFTSINLPRIAIKANGNIDFFFEELERKLVLVSQQLMDRYKIIAQKTVRNFPFLMGQGVWMDSDKLSPDDTVGEVLKHGTLTVGFIGLAECLKALIGKHHGESQEAQNLGIDIVGFMRKSCDRFTKETGMNYSLIATPAEGLSGRFVGIDRRKFGSIPGVTEREYYTNSFHVPVYFDITAYDKIRLEAPYHALTNGGHITYVELDGDPTQNLDAFESVVRFMKETGIGYGSINHPIDRDPECGYNGIINDQCPGCGRTESDGGQPIQRIRRITGYLVGTLERFNNAKRSEEHDRVKHSLDGEVERI
ncbi:anaerobic ribonucleoside triphosphate reductase [Oscillospiraceae bacterium MB08-C2-2]|nr:anaerobic ribonucleoside triphosphate reductase [Oscillospiraceae bacterium MB08-C2-2]